MPETVTKTRRQRFEELCGEHSMSLTNLYQMLTDDELINLALSDAITFQANSRRESFYPTMIDQITEAYQELLTRRQSATPQDLRVAPVCNVEPYTYPEATKAENRPPGGEEDQTSSYKKQVLLKYPAAFLKHAHNLYYIAIPSDNRSPSYPIGNTRNSPHDAWFDAYLRLNSEVFVAQTSTVAKNNNHTK